MRLLSALAVMLAVSAPAAAATDPVSKPAPDVMGDMMLAAQKAALAARHRAGEAQRVPHSGGSERRPMPVADSSSERAVSP